MNDSNWLYREVVDAHDELIADIKASHAEVGSQAYWWAKGRLMTLENLRLKYEAKFKEKSIDVETETT